MIALYIIRRAPITLLYRHHFCAGIICTATVRKHCPVLYRCHYTISYSYLHIHVGETQYCIVQTWNCCMFYAFSFTAIYTLVCSADHLVYAATVLHRQDTGGTNTLCFTEAVVKYDVCARVICLSWYQVSHLFIHVRVVFNSYQNFYVPSHQGLNSPTPVLYVTPRSVAWVLVLVSNHMIYFIYYGWSWSHGS